MAKGQWLSSNRFTQLLKARKPVSVFLMSYAFLRWKRFAVLVGVFVLLYPQPGAAQPQPGQNRPSPGTPMAALSTTREQSQSTQRPAEQKPPSQTGTPPSQQSPSQPGAPPAQPGQN